MILNKLFHNFWHHYLTGGGAGRPTGPGPPPWGAGRFTGGGEGRGGTAAPPPLDGEGLPGGGAGDLPPPPIGGAGLPGAGPPAVAKL